MVVNTRRYLFHFLCDLRFLNRLDHFDNVREKICNAFVLGWECFQYGQILWDLSRWLNDLGAQGTQAGNLLNHCFAPMQDHWYIYKYWNRWGIVFTERKRCEQKTSVRYMTNFLRFFGDACAFFERPLIFAVIAIKSFRYGQHFDESVYIVDTSRKLLRDLDEDYVDNCKKRKKKNSWGMWIIFQRSATINNCLPPQWQKKN